MGASAFSTVTAMGSVFWLPHRISARRVPKAARQALHQPGLDVWVLDLDANRGGSTAGDPCSTPCSWVPLPRRSNDTSRLLPARKTEWMAIPPITHAAKPPRVMGTFCCTALDTCIQGTRARKSALSMDSTFLLLSTALLTPAQKT